MTTTLFLTVTLALVGTASLGLIIAVAVTVVHGWTTHILDARMGALALALLIPLARPVIAWVLLKCVVGRVDGRLTA